MPKLSHAIATTETSMGAVHVRVKLINAIDEELVRRSLLNPNRVKECKAEALLDTGGLYKVFKILLKRNFHSHLNRITL